MDVTCHFYPGETAASFLPGSSEGDWSLNCHLVTEETNISSLQPGCQANSYNEHWTQSHLHTSRYPLRCGLLQSEDKLRLIWRWTITQHTALHYTAYINAAVKGRKFSLNTKIMHLRGWMIRCLPSGWGARQDQDCKSCQISVIRARHDAPDMETLLYWPIKYFLWWELQASFFNLRFPFIKILLSAEEKESLGRV